MIDYLKSYRCVLLSLVVGTAYIGCFFLITDFPINLPRMEPPRFSYDESRASQMILESYEHIINRSYHPYHLQKSLAHIIVGTALKTMNLFLGLDQKSLLLMLHVSMALFNGILLSICTFLLFRIHTSLSISTPFPVLLVLCFFNFAFFVFLAFFPILGAITDFTLSLAMMYCYLSRKTKTLLCFIVLSGFSNPLLLYLSSILLIINGKLDDINAITPLKETGLRIILWILLNTGAIVMFWYGTVYDPVGVIEVMKTWSWPTLFGNPVSIILSFIAIAIFYCGLVTTINIPRIMHNIRRLLDWKYTLTMLLAISTIKFIASYLSVNTNNFYWGAVKDFNNFKTLSTVFIYAASKPGGFFIGHVTFFGSSMLLVFIYWKRLSKQLREADLQQSLFIFFSLAILGIDPESRHLIWLYPWLIINLVKVISLQYKDLYWILPINILLSFLWIAFPLFYSGLAYEQLTLLRFMGGGMSESIYLFVGTNTVIVFACLWYSGVIKR